MDKFKTFSNQRSVAAITVNPLPTSEEKDCVGKILDFPQANKS